MGYGKSLTSMQGLGYKEIIEYIEGRATLDDAVLRLKQNTRHFAKRQLTWFKNKTNARKLDMENFRLRDILKCINAKRNTLAKTAEVQ
jgi:tRNA dimethylallyltransferase